MLRIRGGIGRKVPQSSLWPLFGPRAAETLTRKRYAEHSKIV